MNHFLAIIITLIIAFSIAGTVVAQSIVQIDDCGVSYIDPQDVIIKAAPSNDTVIYQTYFAESNQQRAYYVDVNAFGGQQVDRATVKAILPDGSYKAMGTFAFGNCLDCVKGFALVHDDSLWVEDVADRATMDLWLQSFSQPPFSLTSNLQTLRGVGRISGVLPPCAEGLFVEFIVYGDPTSTTTEFATQVVCPEIIRNCQIEIMAETDCQKDSLFLSAMIPTDCYAADAKLSWWNDQGFQVNTANVALPLSGSEGMYYFQLEEECCIFMDSILVENPAFAQAGPDQKVCLGDAITFNGNGGIRYYWENENGAEIDGGQLVFPAVQLSDGGRYILHAFNEKGCEDKDTLFLEVQVPPTPEIVISDACLGDSIHFSLLNDTAFVQVNWFNPQNIPLTFPLIPNLQETDFGIYSVEAFDALGCRSAIDFPVTGRQPPNFTYTIEDNCDSSRVYLTPDNYQYDWGNGLQGPVLSTNTGGTFNLVITDRVGCQTSTVIEVPPPDGPEVNLHIEHPRCPTEYGAIELTLADPNQPAIFSIDGGETYTLSSRFENLTPGNYNLLVQDDLGCIQHFSAEIQAPDTLGVAINSEELEVRPGTQIRLEAETVGEVIRYQWLPKEIDSATSQTEFTANSNMDIRLIVEDARGCLMSDGIPLTIVLGDIYAPNVFSPDGDGNNDHFILYSDNGSGEIIEFLRIFDRFGELLFEGEDILLNDETSGWDGEYRGKKLNTGVYVYHAVVRFGNSARKAYMGDVLLMR